MIVLPGEEITAVEGGWMRGHGTYLEASALVASSAGAVERVNKLVSVRAPRGRYSGEVGDLVVGRVLDLGHKAWRLEIGGSRKATLQLSSVNLPDDAQRIRTHEDALAMRSVFAEGDVVCAEVQAVHADGSVHLHTRSNRYGKLSNGTLVQVRAALVSRLPAHFLALPSGEVELAVGNNGWVWVQRKLPREWVEAEAAETGGGAGEADALLSGESWNRLRKKHAEMPMTTDQRAAVCRVANAVRVLGAGGVSVTSESISRVYADSLSVELEPSAMLRTANVAKLLQTLLKKSTRPLPPASSSSSKRKRPTKEDDGDDFAIDQDASEDEDDDASEKDDDGDDALR